ncbi:MAG: TIGR01777 family protein [Desulfomonile tiedjei]|nr:TIGR01777 family protein [Desulfomonile tiedjei]
MRVFITGANGFVGTNLIRVLTEAGHSVTSLVRSATKAGRLPAGVSPVLGESTKPGDWQKAVAGHDVLINLAGTSIFSPWNPAYKQLIVESRVLTTKNLVDAIPAQSGSQVTLLSTSAVGYYGCTGDEELNEDSPPGDDFLAALAKAWEAEALQAREKGVRVVITRFGVVLGRDGGALAQMVRPFRFFVGGPLGSGTQWFSWIHIQDLCRAVFFLLDHPEMEGPVNLAAPGSVRNRDLAHAIGKVLHRPSFMPAPGFMLRLILGEFAEVILAGQRVVPRVLTENGFSFNFPDIHAALDNLLHD